MLTTFADHEHARLEANAAIAAAMRSRRWPVRKQRARSTLRNAGKYAFARRRKIALFAFTTLLFFFLWHFREPLRNMAIDALQTTRPAQVTPAPIQPKPRALPQPLPTAATPIAPAAGPGDMATEPGAPGLAL